VEWKVVPQLKPWEIAADAATMIGYLKNAAQGVVPAKGATLHADAADYRDVWGEALYQKVLTAPVSSFGFYQSKGGEVNYGIDVDGNPVKGAVLSAGVGLIWLDGIPIAKWDVNGCLNAINKQSSTPAPNPQPRPNPQDPPVGGNNNQQIVYLPAQKSEMTMNDYLAASSIAEAKQLNAIYAGAAIMKDGINTGAALKTCCGGSSTTSTTVATTSVPLTAIAMPMPMAYPQQQVQQQSTFWPTFAGSALGTLGGTLLGNAINGNRQQQTFIFDQGFNNGFGGFNYTQPNPFGTGFVVNQPGFADPRLYNTSMLNSQLPWY
jgi:hypothetical protein